MYTGSTVPNKRQSLMWTVIYVIESQIWPQMYVWTHTSHLTNLILFWIPYHVVQSNIAYKNQSRPNAINEDKQNYYNVYGADIDKG